MFLSVDKIQVKLVIKTKYQVSSLSYSLWTLSTKEQLDWIQNTKTNKQ